MKLYLADAPESFMLDGFSEASDADPLQFESSPIKINIGAVATRHHAMKVAVRTRADHFAESGPPELLDRIEDENVIDDSQPFIYDDAEGRDDVDEDDNSEEDNSDDETEEAMLADVENAPPTPQSAMPTSAGTTMNTTPITTPTPTPTPAEMQLDEDRQQHLNQKQAKIDVETSPDLLEDDYYSSSPDGSTHGRPRNLHEPEAQHHGPRPSGPRQVPGQRDP